MRKRLFVVAVISACSGEISPSSGSGPGLFIVTSESRQPTTGMATITYQTRQSNYAASGFLDLTIGGTRCPLLLDSTGNVIPGRVCSIGGVPYAIRGGNVAGTNLRLAGSQEGVTVDPLMVSLTYPLMDAGVPDGGAEDAGASDAPVTPETGATVDAGDINTACVTYCQPLLLVCASSSYSTCQSDCVQNLRAASGRCASSFNNLTECASRTSPTCLSPFFSGCDNAYLLFQRCARGL